MGIIERAVEMAQSEEKAAEVEKTHAPAQDASHALPMAPRAAIAPPAQLSPVLEAVPPAPVDLKPRVHLDFVRLRELGRVPPEGNSRQIKEEMRRIKWPLLKAITARAGAEAVRNNVIVITSALPGEGKSFIALNLALSIVRDREQHVILVDGDVARPGLTPALGLEDRPGLNDVLEDDGRDVGSVTYQTDVEGLFVVPAGKWHEQASELFASSRMPLVLDELMRRVGNGVIIVDSPPLLATNEAQVVTRHVGQVVVVVRADETEQRIVQEAIALIDESAAVTAVLNAVRPSFLGRYYGGYHYGYGYGDGVRGSQRRERSGEPEHE